MRFTLASHIVTSKSALELHYTIDPTTAIQNHALVMENPPIHIFEPAFTIQKQRKPKVKRKKDAQKDSDKDSDDSSSSPSASSTTSPSSEEETNPPPHFPHAPLDRSQTLGNPSKIPKRHRNTKHQHASVLNAILHKSMLEGDFVRAGRAFACLIRFELRRDRINLRKQGLWGIASEILLRRDGGVEDEDAHDDDHGTFGESKATDRDAELEKLPYTAQGLADAKRFFERLMLQYPVRGRGVPNKLLTEVHFLPVMYGLEVFHLQARMERAKQIALAGAAEPVETGRWRDPRASKGAAASAATNREQGTIADSDAESGAEDVDEDVQMSGMPDDNNAASKIESTQRVAAVQEAIDSYVPEVERVLTDLDSRTMLPPFDRSPKLLRLKGDIWLWMADLSPTAKPEWLDVARDAHTMAADIEQASLEPEQGDKAKKKKKREIGAALRKRKKEKEAKNAQSVV